MQPFESFILLYCARESQKQNKEITRLAQYIQDMSYLLIRLKLLEIINEFVIRTNWISVELYTVVSVVIFVLRCKKVFHSRIEFVSR